MVRSTLLTMKNGEIAVVVGRVMDVLPSCRGLQHSLDLTQHPSHEWPTNDLRVLDAIEKLRQLDKGEKLIRLLRIRRQRTALEFLDLHHCIIFTDGVIQQNRCCRAERPIGLMVQAPNAQLYADTGTQRLDATPDVIVAQLSASHIDLG